jgi:hypothetical protein
MSEPRLLPLVLLVSSSPEHLAFDEGRPPLRALVLGVGDLFRDEKAEDLELLDVRGNNFSSSLLRCHMQKKSQLTWTTTQPGVLRAREVFSVPMCAATT